MSISKLRKAGYTVEESHPATDEQAAIFHVSGFGVEIYVLESDTEVFTALLASHPVRVEAMKSTEGSEVL